ncbi:MAG: LrgB family protein [Peptococcaceae bacterium]|nr:LrgB family protein [Peptococcaceae bacterium]
MSELLYSPYFGVIATIFAYQAGVSIQKKVKHPLANPILIAVLLICTLLVIMDIPLEAYQEGGNLIYLFLAPATAALAVPIYKNWQILRLNWKPIIAGTMAGSFSSIVIVFALCKLFKLEESLTLSLLSKSVTTPIAVGITEQLGGIVPIAIAAVIFSGITGNIMAPFLVKVFRVEDPVAQGIGIGTASHAIGTTRAITMGELQGAMSGLAIGLSGLWTVFWAFLFSVWIG